jgi:Beta-propeller repeat
MTSSDGGESWKVHNGLGGTAIRALAARGPGILYASVFEDGQAFAAKLDPRGDLVFSTYLGGRSIDSATGIAVDPTGGIWVTGFTTSADFPTQNPLQGQLTGSRDRYSAGNAFLVKIKE